MATNLQLEDKLIEEAVRLGEHRTKKDAVTKALESYVGHLKRLQILDLFGTIEYGPDHDYKEQRKRS